MWQFILLTLRRQKGRNILASGGFLLAACTLILLSASTQTTVLQAAQIISKNWRSTYDLVVLPPQPSMPTGTTIAPDQFEGYDGGISVQQYQQIKQLSGVAVAAPIAFISYALFPTTVIQLGPPHPAPGFYRLDWTLTAFNGQQSITEFHQSVRVYASDSCTGECGLTSDQQHILSSIGVSDYFFTQNGQYLTVVPNPGTFLLAGIDPAAENQLVHLDQSITQGSQLPEQTMLSLDTDQPTISGIAPGEQDPNYDVPMLINTQLPGHITLHASFVHLAASTTDPQQVATLGGSNYLDHLSQQTVFVGNVPIAQNDLQIFAKGTTVAQQGSSLEIQDYGNSSFALNFTSSPSSLAYQHASAPKGETRPAYTLVPDHFQNLGDMQGPEVAFRNLNPLPGNMQQEDGTIGYTDQVIYDTIYNGATYTAQPIGQFDGKRLSAEFTNALNWLPENTYTPSPLILQYDAQGHPLTPTSILPTTNPAGFTLQSPLALTTLAAARQIRGEHCISVIRIRVAGNVTADAAGWEHVAQVAQEIQRRTGLRAIVTLGSSPRPTLVYVPGINAGQYPGATQTIAPLGWVEERWISIGAALLYLKQLGQTQTLLLWSVLAVCLGYLVVSLSALVTAQRRELAILSALGWRPWQPVGTFLVQVLLLALGGGIVGIGLALLIVSLIGADPPWQVVVWTLPLMLGLALVSVLYPLQQLWRIRPAEILRTGTTVASGRALRIGARMWWFMPAIVSIALRNLARSRVRALVAIGSLFLSALLLMVMMAGLLALRQTLQGTLLGDFVLLQTAVPQLAGALFAVLLTFASISDLLLLQVRERQREIGLLRAIGWRPGLIRRLFLHEGLTLSIVGAIPGAVVASGILFAQRQAQGGVPLPVVAGSVTILLVVVATLATIPAVRAANRVQVVDILRAE
ncbi:MAG: FtsX-like permease family protein [Ktedonobacteraceae bacterium]